MQIEDTHLECGSRIHLLCAVSCDGFREDRTEDVSQGKRQIIENVRDEAHLQRISDLRTPSTRNTWDFDTQDQDLGTPTPRRITTVGVLQRAYLSQVVASRTMPAILLLR